MNKKFGIVPKSASKVPLLYGNLNLFKIRNSIWRVREIET